MSRGVLVALLTASVCLLCMGIADAGGPPKPPNAPSDLVATAVSETQVDLTWNDNANNENGFLIQRKVGAGGTFVDLDTVGANVESYPDTSCDPSTTYCYQVRAYNSYGDSAWSNEDCATTSGPAPPAAPSNLDATAVSTSEVDLDWVDNSNDEDGFVIEVATATPTTPTWTVRPQGAGE